MPTLDELSILAPYLGILLITLPYFSLVIIVRWHMIARPYHHHIQAEIELVQARLDARHSLLPRNGETKGHHPVGRESKETDLQDLWESSKSLLARARETLEGFTLFDFLFWSRGQEVKALHYVRAADRLLLKLDHRAMGWESLRERLEHLAVDLDGFKGPEARKRIALIQQAVASTGKDKDSPEHWIAAVGCGLESLNNLEIDSFQGRLERLNRTVWLIYITLSLITLLSWFVGNTLLFLAGAVGGLISRLLSLVKDRDLQHSTQNSWPQMLLSPVLGALAGWIGVLLAVVTKTEILGAQPDWEHPAALATMAFAVFMGLSERFLTVLLDRAAGEPRVKDPTPAVELDAANQRA